MVKTCIHPSAIVSSFLFTEKEVIGFHVHNDKTNLIQESYTTVQERSLQKLRTRFLECSLADTIVAYACGDTDEMRLRIINDIHSRCPKIRFINIPDINLDVVSEYPTIRAVCDLFNLVNCVEIYQVTHFSSFSLLASMLGENCLHHELASCTLVQSMWTPSNTFDTQMYKKNNVRKMIYLVRDGSDVSDDSDTQTPSIHQHHHHQHQANLTTKKPSQHTTVTLQGDI
jgi:hypothetical protein